MRRKMNVTILAQLATRRERSIGAKVKGLEVRSRRRDGENLIGFLSRKWQSSNRKLSSRRATGQVFDNSRVVACSQRMCDILCLAAALNRASLVENTGSAITAMPFGAGLSIRQSLTLNRQR